MTFAAEILLPARKPVPLMCAAGTRMTLAMER